MPIFTGHGSNKYTRTSDSFSGVGDWPIRERACLTGDALQEQRAQGVRKINQTEVSK